MTPAIFTGGFGHSPIATPRDPATGQPLSPYGPQAGGVGGFGHPAGTMAPAAPYQPAANYGAATTPLGAARAAFSGMSSVAQPVAQPGAVTSPPGGTTFKNQFGSYTVPQGDPYYAQGTQPSTNAATFTTQPYISGVNENWGAQMTNMYNAQNPGQKPTTFNEADWSKFWNSMTANGTGYSPGSANAAGLFSGPGAAQLQAEMMGNFSSFNPNPQANLVQSGYTAGGMGSQPPTNAATNYSPANAFSPQGAGSTLPNMFGQGSTGVNSGTNIAGGGGNIFGGTGAAGTGAGSPWSGSLLMGPPITGANQYVPGMSGGAGTYGTPDQALGSLAGNLGYLQNIAAGGGNPVNASPAWNSAVAAMQQQIGTGAADLAARFAGSGNLDSSTYGTAMQQYYNQAQLQENALTAQYGFQSATDAQNRLLSAAQQLGAGGTQALQQLSSQAYGANQATQAQQAQMAMGMLGAGSNAASQLSQQSYGASSQLNQAAIQAVMANLQNQQYLQSLGMSGASQLSQNWIQNLMAGMGLGQNQYIDQQSAINNQYQEWLRTQAQNNPFLQMMYSAVTTYPGQAATSYAPPSLGSLLQGFGSLLGAGGLSNIGAILKQIGIGGQTGNTGNVTITPPGGNGGGGGGTDLGTLN